MPKKINWKKSISRTETPIRSEVIAKGASVNVKKLIGVDNDNFLFVFREGKGTAYFDSEQIKMMGEKISEIIREDPSFLKKHSKDIRGSCSNLVNVSKKIGGRNHADRKLIELRKDFHEFLEAHYEFSPYMMIPVAIEKVIGRKVRSLLIKNKRINGNQSRLEFYLTKLLTPRKLPEVSKELRDLLEIVEVARGESEAEFKQQVKTHWQKYCWLSVYSPDVLPYKLSYFENKVKDLLKTKLKTTTKDDVRNSGTFTKLVKELQLNEEELNYIKLLREYVYLRTYRVEQLSKAYFYIQPLFVEIAKRGGISLYSLCLCNLDEICNFLDGGKLPSKKGLETRHKHYLYIMTGGVFKSYSGQEAEKIFTKEVSVEGVEVNTKTNKIVGNPACLGRGKGIAHVIIDIEKLSSFEEGEVLVTTMTSPDYVIAMKKASAVITDEGGVLCHAAIVSRELGTPCVVGTKNATKIIKDGDLIEVDADKGLVKVLQKTS